MGELDRVSAMRGNADHGVAPRLGAEHLEPMLADVVRETGASVGLLYLLPPDGKVLWLAVVSGIPGELAAPWARVPMDAPMPVVDAVRQRRLLWINSREELARRYPRVEIVLPYNFMCAAAPLSGGTPVWGGLVLLWPVWHPPQLSDRERRAIATSCERASDLLARAADSGRPVPAPGEPRVIAAPATRADPAQAMAAFGFAERLPVGCCALDRNGRLTFINRAAAEMLDAGAASLTGRRPWEALLWLHGPLFEERYRAALVTREQTSFVAVRPPDMELLFRLYPGDDGISIHITPAAPQPLADPRHRLPPPAESASAASLHHLTHLAAALAEAVCVDDVVEAAADQIVPAFGPQGMAVMTVEDGRESIIGHRGYTAEFLDRFRGAPVRSGSPAARTATSGEGYFFPTFADFRRAHPAARRHEGRNAWAFLPLIASGRPIGSLVLSYDKPQPFPLPERAVLSSVAGLVAQSLARARLYDANRALAGTLQTGLLPHALPDVPGLDVAARYLPAGQAAGIGGDFYDLIRCGDHCAVAAIGDVQGHNTAAAALMGQVRIAVHAHAAAGTAPGDLLARTNHLLTDLDPGLFTSCLVARLDVARHRACLATAGHPPPLLRHPDGRTEILSPPPGLLLGIEPDADYPTAETSLPPGAVLALYTDGLVEAPGTDIDRSTRDLAENLARTGDRDLDELADAMVHHCGQFPPRPDDIALLLIRHRPQGG